MNVGPTYLRNEMFSTMISDEHLMGALEVIPTIKDDSTDANILKATFSLYGGKYKEAINYADKILEEKQSEEALYVKNPDKSAIFCWILGENGWVGGAVSDA